MHSLRKNEERVAFVLSAICYTVILNSHFFAHYASYKQTLCSLIPSLRGTGEAIAQQL